MHACTHTLTLPASFLIERAFIDASVGLKMIDRDIVFAACHRMLSFTEASESSFYTILGRGQVFQVSRILYDAERER